MPRKGGLVLGVCNGFQILCEAGLLPGVLMRNAALKFICRDVYLRVERSDTPFTRGYNAGQVIRVPVAHGEGNYVADAETIARLEGEGRVLFRYAAPDGTLDPNWNVNGATNAIAGILNEKRQRARHDAASGEPRRSRDRPDRRPRAVRRAGRSISQGGMHRRHRPASSLSDVLALAPADAVDPGGMDARSPTMHCASHELASNAGPA